MKALAIVPALALAACAATTPPSHPTGTTTAGFGQTASVGGLLVTPIALIEDSRCPANANCVWAGRLVVKAQIRSDRSTQVHNLALATPLPAAGGELTLTNAVPEKNASRPNAMSDYRFTFRFDDSR